MILKLILPMILIINISECDDFEGCYRPNTDRTPVRTLGMGKFLDKCLEYCKNKSYRFMEIENEFTCYCNNLLGSHANNSFCDITCSFDNRNTCGSKDAKYSSVYSTGIRGPGPPKNINIKKVTDTSVHLSWTAPVTYSDIISYRANVYPMQTYSMNALMNKTFEFSNNTFHTEISSLHPGTKYSLTLQAISEADPGAIANESFETLIGEPDHAPTTPTIISRDSTTMTIKITPSINNNGPITFYQIVIINDDIHQNFQPDLLKSYNESVREGLHYYITAEIYPEDIRNNFVVGDGKKYGPYYNAPLDKNADYHVALGIVSKKNNIFKVGYTNTSNGVIILKINNSNLNSPTIVIVLSVAIGIITFLLILGLVALYLLKLRVGQIRQRLPDNQELTLQGPMIEIENNGYIPEDEMAPVNHYDNLKQQVWSIPRNFINIKNNTIIADGKFGRLVHGEIQKDGNTEKVAIYTIFDKDLSQPDKRSMLMDLDILIKAGKHPNIITLIGTCETPDNIHVVLEAYSDNLKDVLIQSRKMQGGKFTTVSELLAFDFAIGIANGMAKLTQIKMVHKQLCARNIILANRSVPKIAGFGLCEYTKNLDTTRWTAQEILRGRPASLKSDIWSYGCVLWEIFSLGGTPYAGISNTEIKSCVTRGLRLPQLQYVGDGLFQLIINCCQIDLDERPSFTELVDLLDALKLRTETAIPELNFNFYPGFQYEHFAIEMEITDNIRQY